LQRSQHANRLDIRLFFAYTASHAGRQQTAWCPADRGLLDRRDTAPRGTDKAQPEAEGGNLRLGSVGYTGLAGAAVTQILATELIPEEMA
jgi:hypothetical protein